MIAKLRGTVGRFLNDLYAGYHAIPVDCISWSVCAMLYLTIATTLLCVTMVDPQACEPSLYWAHRILGKLFAKMNESSSFPFPD
jgi:hypothetical protein